MINQGDIIKHEAFMDVAVQIISTSTHPDTGDVEIRGIWINQGQVETFAINKPANFVIKKENLSRWSKCLEPKSNFIRNANWKKINEC